MASLFLPRVLLPLLLFFFLLPISKAEANTDFFLHGDGPNNNPPTLFLDNASPTASTPKFKDSTSVNFNGGNPWKEVGTWDTESLLTDGELTSLSDLYVWLGLKNSDDQGTRFDVLAEVQKNGATVTSGLTRCVTGLTRNQNLAQEVAVPFDGFTSVVFDGTTDVFSLKVSTRIGTNSDETKCGGHNNAVGLRLYFDSGERDSRFDADISQVQPTLNRAYVTNTNPSANSVSVIDIDTDTVLGTIPVGNEPRGVVFHPGTNRVYVANTYGASISVIDAVTNSVIQTIPVTGHPLEITVSQDGTRVYAADFGPTNTVAVIDATSNTLLTTLTGFSNPHSVQVHPDGSRLYIVNANCCTKTPGWISVHDTTTFTQLATIPLGLEPTGFTITPDGSRLYIADNTPAETLGQSRVAVIDTLTNTVITNIPVADTPKSVAVNSTGTRIYVSSTYLATGNIIPGTVSVIDTGTNSVLETFTVGFIPDSIAVSADDTKLYIVDSAVISPRNTISVYSIPAHSFLGTVTTGLNPAYISTKP